MKQTTVFLEIASYTVYLYESASKEVINIYILKYTFYIHATEHTG